MHTQTQKYFVCLLICKVWLIFVCVSVGMCGIGYDCPTAVSIFIYFQTFDGRENTSRHSYATMKRESRRVRCDRINSLFGDERLCLMNFYYYLIFNAINNSEEKLYNKFHVHFYRPNPFKCRRQLHRFTYGQRMSRDRDRCVQNYIKKNRRCSMFVPKHLWRRPVDRLLLKLCFRPLCQNMEIIYSLYAVHIFCVAYLVNSGKRHEMTHEATCPVFFCLCAIWVHVVRRNKRWMMINGAFTYTIATTRENTQIYDQYLSSDERRKYVKR